MGNIIIILKQTIYYSDNMIVHASIDIHSMR